MRSITCLVLLTALATAQMEKRWTGRYDGVSFAKAAPTVGSLVPDLILADLDGRAHALHEHLGRTIVLIKAAYT